MSFFHRKGVTFSILISFSLFFKRFIFVTSFLYHILEPPPLSFPSLQAILGYLISLPPTLSLFTKRALLHPVPSVWAGARIPLELPGC